MSPQPQLIDPTELTNHYDKDYQPDYPNEGALQEASDELRMTEAVTTPRQIDALQKELTALAEGRINRPIIITGPCAEEIDVTIPIETLVSAAVTEQQIVLNALPKAIVVQRNRGQGVKPRSSAVETLPDGRTVVSYMGDAINSKDPANRLPDPTRLVAMAVQSRDLEQGITDTTDGHLPAAHEALSLDYEAAFVRKDPETGCKYLLSTDLPWVGKRTNHCAIDPRKDHNPHIEMLAEVANPIGVKIGPDSTAEHIEALQARLNPDDIPGKLILMLRAGHGKADKLNEIVASIAQYAPGAIIMYDIHGVTRTAPTGEKIRYTDDIVDDIRQTAETCHANGLKLHGLHLETTMDENQHQCVDRPDELPTHPGGVDPQLNPRQLAYVLDKTQEYLL